MECVLIRASILKSGRIQKLTDFEERVYTRMLFASDYAGRLEATPTLLKSSLFPASDDPELTNKIKNVIPVLIESDLIYLYIYQNKEYIQITRFRPQPTAKNSKFPDAKGNRKIERIMYNGDAIISTSLTNFSIDSKIEKENTTDANSVEQNSINANFIEKTEAITELSEATDKLPDSFQKLPHSFEKPLYLKEQNIKHKEKIINNKNINTKDVDVIFYKKILDIMLELRPDLIPNKAELKAKAFCERYPDAPNRNEKHLRASIAGFINKSFESDFYNYDSDFRHVRHKMITHGVDEEEVDKHAENFVKCAHKVRFNIEANDNYTIERIKGYIRNFINKNKNKEVK